MHILASALCEGEKGHAFEEDNCFKVQSIRGSLHLRPCKVLSLQNETDLLENMNTGWRKVDKNARHAITPQARPDARIRLPNIEVEKSDRLGYRD